MICPICKDIILLGRKSTPAVPEDTSIGQDLLDTLSDHRAECVGMAANMLGQSKRIIVFDNAGIPTLMYNPEIIKKTCPYEAEEGCLSLTGTRKTTRYKSIKVRYQNEAFQVRLKTFQDFTAQIIQHEIDHCEGIII